MLDFPKDTKNEMKCNVKHGTMGRLDPKQPPIKRQPFAAILSHHFVHKVELILPGELYEIIKDGLLASLSSPVYHRVILPLKALLEGDFFNDYIKKGNVIMLSEGRTGVDNVYSLREGILTLRLDKKSYEQAGLAGKPDGIKGKRGTKPRWVVEINLRLPSMLHGKRGFDRIVYAFKNVLAVPVTWLFSDLGTTALTPDPLDQHFPTKVNISPGISPVIQVNMPELRPPLDADVNYGAEFEDYAVEIHEWLSLIQLQSPRVRSKDKIDSFLSRYVAPGATTSSTNIVKITWDGLISPSWAQKLCVQILLVAPQDQWFAFYVSGFVESWSGTGRDCTTLKLPGAPTEYVLWEVL